MKRQIKRIILLSSIVVLYLGSNTTYVKAEANFHMQRIEYLKNEIVISDYESKKYLVTELMDTIEKIEDTKVRQIEMEAVIKFLKTHRDNPYNDEKDSIGEELIITKPNVNFNLQKIDYLKDKISVSNKEVRARLSKDLMDSIEKIEDPEVRHNQMEMAIEFLKETEKNKRDSADKRLFYLVGILIFIVFILERYP